MTYKPPPGWTHEVFPSGAQQWENPEHTIRVIYLGRKTSQAFTPLFLRDGHWLPDIGYPSFKAVFDYLAGKRSLRDHPLHRRI